MSSHLPRRIACLQPSATVTLAAVGQLDRLVACTRYCKDVVPEIADQPRRVLHDSWAASAEEIVSVRPDLVIGSVPYQEQSVIEILKSGIPFLGLAPRTLSDIYSDIAVIAGIVGAHDRGQQVIDSMKRHIDSVCERVREKIPSTRLRVFCEEWGKPLIASQRWVAEMIDAIGGDFVGTPGKQISQGEVQTQDPEIVVAAWCGAGDRIPLEKIVVDRGWQGIRAARSSRVYCIRDELLNTPALTLMRGLDALAWALYPEALSQPKGIRQITKVLQEPS